MAVTETIEVRKVQGLLCPLILYLASSFSSTIRIANVLLYRLVDLSPPHRFRVKCSYLQHVFLFLPLIGERGGHAMAYATLSVYCVFVTFLGKHVLECLDCLGRLLRERSQEQEEKLEVWLCK